MKAVIAQLNLLVGDLKGNAAKILDAAKSAAAVNADLLLTPELSICSYQPEDLLLPAGSSISMPLAATPTPSPTSIRSEPTAPTVSSHLPDEPKTQPMLPMVNNLEGYLEGLERAAILRALEATRYNKTAAAEKLGISFRALRYRLKKLGLE